jgi:replicative DNA helicase
VNEDVEVILSKHRNGPLGTINMAFLKENLNFLEYDKEG